MKLKIIFLTIIINLIFSISFFGKEEKYNLAYNSPNFNVYLKTIYKNKLLIVKGFIEDNFWCPMNTITIYIEGLDEKNRKIDEKRYYISEIQPIPEYGSKKFFMVKLRKGKKIIKLHFTINFKYEAYKISDIDNFEDFYIMISHTQF